MGNDLAVRLRSELTESLRRKGALRSARWVDAFRSVPRHEFLAEFFAPSEGGSSWRLVSTADGDEWLRLAYADEAWVTQIDADPHPLSRRGAGERVTGSPTSSSSAPSLMARMLEALDVTEHSRVLELGTGTGYNAGLLSAGLPRGQVSSMDIDPVLVRRAAGVLGHLGYRPHLETSDGDSSAPVRGDGYDRLIITYGTPRVPARWLSLLRPGGVIVAPLHRELAPGMVLRLAIVGEYVARGRFLPFYGAFMPTRRRATADLSAALDAHRSGQGTTRPTSLRVPVFGASSGSCQDYAALALGDVQQIGVLPEGATDPAQAQHWLIAPDGSWACPHPGAGNASAVTEGGPRRLWAELEAAVAEWHGLGEPGRDRFGLTVRPDAHELWIDEPGQVVRALP